MRRPYETIRGHNQARVTEYDETRRHKDIAKTRERTIIIRFQSGLKLCLEDWMPATQLDTIRNIAVIGHGAVGKTTLVDAMIFKAGAVDRQGDPQAGTSVSDFGEEEKERKISLDTSILRCDWKGATLNILDTPGYPDFIGEAACALAAADVAAVVVAAPAGIEINTRTTWGMADRDGLGRFIVVSKMDGENIDVPSLVAALQEIFGSECVPVNLPVGTGERFAGVVGCLDVPDNVPDGVIGDPVQAHETLMERIIEVDDSFLERYLDGEEVSRVELESLFTRAIAAGSVVPILFCSTRKDAGVEELLDAFAAFAPSPALGVKRRACVAGTDEAVELQYSPGNATAALVFKIVTDPFVGKLAYLRLYDGTIRADEPLYITSTGKGVKAGGLFLLQGKEQEAVQSVTAGGIAAVSRIEELSVGDSVSSETRKLDFAPIVAPEPMVALAVEPKSRADEQRISGALAKLCDEDPTFAASRDRQTKELVIRGTSSLHLDVMLNELKRRFDVDVVTKQPRIAYLETVTVESEARYKHKKQTGGRGQYGEVYVRIEPLERGSGFEFEDKVVGGVIPNQFIPAVEKGVRAALEGGVLAGYPVVDLRLTLFDGSHHSVDSSEAAFKIAGARAFREAFLAAKPVVLEPLAKVEITVPGEFMGDIAGDINSRRGRILGMDTVGGMQVIKAVLPQAEAANYATQLRSMTGGNASYTLAFSHYDLVPARVQEQIVAQNKTGEEPEND